MPKVSAIVPCLNMREYIEDCLKSIVNQTLSEIEILVVDAGSTDGTLDILNRYMQSDKRIRLIHSTKKSYGYQVNLGIRQAAGEYIAIVDADDRIASDMYKVLYEEAVCSGVDYVKGTAKSFYTVSNNFTYYKPLGQFPEAEYQNGRIDVTPAERTDLLTKDNFLWYGIFRREFMKGIYLHESPGAAFQDFGGLLQTQMKAQKAVYLEDAFYEYRQDNAMASNQNPKGFQFVWEEYTWVEQFIAEASEEWKAAFYRKLFLHTLSIYAAMAASEIIWENSRNYMHLIGEKLAGKLETGILRKEHFSGDEWENLQILLESADGLSDRFLKRHMDRKKQLQNIMITAGDRKIVIFGYGAVGVYVYAQIEKHSLGGMVAFCDNQVKKHGLKYDKVPVLTPVEAVGLYPEACFVITSSRYFADMEKQLISMNIPQNHICAYTGGIDMRMFGISLLNDITA